MWINLEKYSFRAAIFWTCSVLAMITLMATAPLLSITPQANFAMGGLAAYFTALILFSIQRLRKVYHAIWQQQLQLTQEAKALNDHAIVSMTDKETRLCYVNQKFLDATGYAKAEVIGRLPLGLYCGNAEGRLSSIIERER